MAIKHYIDSGTDYPIPYEHNDKDMEEIFPKLRNKWNSLVDKFYKDKEITPTTRKEFMAEFLEYYKNDIWDVHEVMYSYEISEAFGKSKLGGCLSWEELYLDEPERKATVNVLSRWKKAGMSRKEFILYYHDLVMDVCFGLVSPMLEEK